MTFKFITVGDVRKNIKGLPDDMPVYLQNADYPEYIKCSFIRQKVLNLDPDHYDVETETKIDALCFYFSTKARVLEEDEKDE